MNGKGAHGFGLQNALQAAGSPAEDFAYASAGFTSSIAAFAKVRFRPASSYAGGSRCSATCSWGFDASCEARGID